MKVNSFLEAAVVVFYATKYCLFYLYVFTRVLLLVTWQEVTKKQVQKPTVSKDFPYAQNATRGRRFERSDAKWSAP